MRKFYSTLALFAIAAALALPGAANAQQKITIGIPTSPPNIVHMPVIIAKELGLYKKAGLDVDIGSLSDGVKVFRGLLAGNIGLGLTPGAPTIIGISNGAAVKALSANLPKLEASLVVRADIKTMADLKGKRIGIQEPGGFADILSRACARRQDRRRTSISSASPAKTCRRWSPIGRHRDPASSEMLAKSRCRNCTPSRGWGYSRRRSTPRDRKMIKDKPAVVQAVVTANIEATRACTPIAPDHPDFGQAHRLSAADPGRRALTTWSRNASGTPIAASAPSGPAPT